MRILLIDNDDDFRTALAEVLAAYEHEVIAYHGPADVSLKPTHFAGITLALLDREVFRHSDRADLGGEPISRELAQSGVPTVFLTGSPPTGHVLFDQLRTGVVTGIADKRLPIEEIVWCINAYRLGRAFPNALSSFMLKENESADPVAVWEFVREHVGLMEPKYGEFSVLFRHLVPPCATRVLLNPIGAGKSGAAILRAEVCFGDVPVRDHVAVKFGRKEVIRSEALRYDRYVGPLPDGVASQLRWRSETESLGAIAYSWVGDSLEDGSWLGSVENWRRRESVLRRLFSRSLNSWYYAYRHGSSNLPSPVSLFTAYARPGGILADGCDFRKLSIPPADVLLPIDLTVREETWEFREWGRLCNPVNWAVKFGQEQLVTSLCPCHGDLHIGNLFVLPDNSPRLIDFGRTGLSHVFRDFAALECSLRMCGITNTNANALKKMEDVLSEVSSITDYVDHRSLPAEGGIRDAVRATVEIRRAAADACGSKAPKTPLREYLFAVVMHMLKYASGTADEVRGPDTRRPVRIGHACYAAAKAADVTSREGRELAT